MTWTAFLSHLHEDQKGFVQGASETEIAPIELWSVFAVGTASCEEFQSEFDQAAAAAAAMTKLSSGSEEAATMDAVVVDGETLVWMKRLWLRWLPKPATRASEYETDNNNER